MKQAADTTLIVRDLNNLVQQASIVETKSTAQDAITLVTANMSDSSGVKLLKIEVIDSPFIISDLLSADWVGALSTLIAAGFAIWGAFVAWKSFKNQQQQQQNQLNDHQDQLNSLAKIAEGLTIQVDESKERRRLEIRPYLTLVSQLYRTKISHGDTEILHVCIENIGDTAIDIRFYYGGNSDIDCSIIDKSIIIYFQKQKTIEVRRRNVNKHAQPDHFKFYVCYSDRDGNSYYQEIYSVDLDLYCNPPILLGPSDDEYTKLFELISDGESDYEMYNTYSK